MKKTFKREHINRNEKNVVHDRIVLWAAIKSRRHCTLLDAWRPPPHEGKKSAMQYIHSLIDARGDTCVHIYLVDAIGTLLV